MEQRMSVARCCCHCIYEGADGNEYSDNFASLDPGWSLFDPTDQSQAVVSGQLVLTATNNNFTPDLSTRMSSPIASMTALKVILECNVFPGDDVTLNSLTGISWHVPISGHPPQYALWAMWNRGEFWGYVKGVFSVFARVPVAGDKLTIMLKDAGAGRVQVCYFVNETLLHEGNILDSFTGSIRYGVQAAHGSITFPIDIGKFDNFSLHVGNP